jgi:hypothetical protein
MYLVAASEIRPRAVRAPKGSYTCGFFLFGGLAPNRVSNVSGLTRLQRGRARMNVEIYRNLGFHFRTSEESGLRPGKLAIETVVVVGRFQPGEICFPVFDRLGNGRSRASLGIPTERSN